MTGLEKLFFLLKSQVFVKIAIVFLTIGVNVLLVEKPAETIYELIKNIVKHSMFVFFVLLVFSPVLTPWLVVVLGKYFTLASQEALGQLAFGIVLLSAQQIILYAKHYFNNRIKDVEKGTT